MLPALAVLFGAEVVIQGDSVDGCRGTAVAEADASWKPSRDYGFWGFDQTRAVSLCRNAVSYLLTSICANRVIGKSLLKGESCGP